MVKILRRLSLLKWEKLFTPFFYSFIKLRLALGEKLRLTVTLKTFKWNSSTFINFYFLIFKCYEVKGTYSETPLLKMDRSATCLFGIRNYGVDINGFVNHPELGLCIWLQRRSPTKQTWPGKWDNMVCNFNHILRLSRRNSFIQEKILIIFRLVEASL